jgi:hypothetical protein
MSVWGSEGTISAILSSLTASPGPDKKIAKLAFTWNPDGTVATIKFYDPNNNLLFTLTFAWNPDSTLNSVSRS